MNPRLHNWAMTVANSVKASIEKPAKSEHSIFDSLPYDRDRNYALENHLAMTRTDEDPGLDITDPRTWAEWTGGRW